MKRKPVTTLPSDLSQRGLFKQAMSGASPAVTPSEDLPWKGNLPIDNSNVIEFAKKKRSSRKGGPPPSNTSELPLQVLDERLGRWLAEHDSRPRKLVCTLEVINSSGKLEVNIDKARELQEERNARSQRMKEITTPNFYPFEKHPGQWSKADVENPIEGWYGASVPTPFELYANAGTIAEKLGEFQLDPETEVFLLENQGVALTHNMSSNPHVRSSALKKVKTHREGTIQEILSMYSGQLRLTQSFLKDHIFWYKDEADNDDSYDVCEHYQTASVEERADNQPFFDEWVEGISTNTESVLVSPRTDQIDSEYLAYCQWWYYANKADSAQRRLLPEKQLICRQKLNKQLTLLTTQYCWIPPDYYESAHLAPMSEEQKLNLWLFKYHKFSNAALTDDEKYSKYWKDVVSKIGLKRYRFYLETFLKHKTNNNLKDSAVYSVVKAYNRSKISRSTMTQALTNHRDRHVCKRLNYKHFEIKCESLHHSDSVLYEFKEVYRRFFKDRGYDIPVYKLNNRDLLPVLAQNAVHRISRKLSKENPDSLLSKIHSRIN